MSTKLLMLVSRDVMYGKNSGVGPISDVNIRKPKE